MTAPLVVPFNFQPVSVSIKTSSYTIPAGQYAYVTAFVSNGGTFTIDTVTSLTSEALSVTNVSGSLAGGSSYTVASGRRFEGQYTFTSGTNVSLGGMSVTTGTSNPIFGVKLGSGASITHTGTNQTTYSGVEIKDMTENVASFWVPTGTVINGTGTWKATVSLYNQIT